MEPMVGENVPLQMRPLRPDSIYCMPVSTCRRFLLGRVTKNWSFCLTMGLHQTNTPCILSVESRRIARIIAHRPSYTCPFGGHYELLWTGSLGWAPRKGGSRKGHRQLCRLPHIARDIFRLLGSYFRKLTFLLEDFCVTVAVGAVGFAFDSLVSIVF
jgi:hypothetical protein